MHYITFHPPACPFLVSLGLALLSRHQRGRKTKTSSDASQEAPEEMLSCDASHVRGDGGVLGDRALPFPAREICFASSAGLVPLLKV